MGVTAGEILREGGLTLPPTPGSPSGKKTAGRRQEEKPDTNTKQNGLSKRLTPSTTAIQIFFSQGQDRFTEGTT